MRNDKNGDNRIGAAQLTFRWAVNALLVPTKDKVNAIAVNRDMTFRKEIEL